MINKLGEYALVITLWLAFGVTCFAIGADHGRKKTYEILKRVLNDQKMQPKLFDCFVEADKK